MTSFVLSYPRGRRNTVAFRVNDNTVDILSDAGRRRVTIERARNIYRDFLNAGYVVA